MLPPPSSKRKRGDRSRTGRPGAPRPRTPKRASASHVE
jgi:hypothetical protein